MKTKEILLPRSLVFNRSIDKIKKKIAKLLDAGKYKKVKINPSELNIFATQVNQKEHKGKVYFTHPSDGTPSVEFPDFQKHPVVAKLKGRDKYLVVDGHNRTASATYSKSPITVYMVEI